MNLKQKFIVVVGIYINKLYKYISNFLNNFYSFLGVDPVIVCSELVHMKSDTSAESSKWVRSVQLVAHRVEVRSLVHFKGKLFSGGN